MLDSCDVVRASRCSNYIFILDFTPGFNGLGKDNFKKRREPFKFWDLVRLILEIWRYVSLLHWHLGNRTPVNEPRYPDSKVHGVNMGPIWGRQDPGGPHVGPMNFAVWVDMGAIGISPQQSTINRE